MTSPSPLLLLSTVNICLDFLIYPFFFFYLHLGPFFFCFNFILLCMRPDVGKFSVFVYLEILCFPSWRIVLLGCKILHWQPFSISSIIFTYLPYSIVSFEKSAISLVVAPLGNKSFFSLLLFFGFQKFYWCT